jgi:ADP-heptose:LPS heptosyltransferase
MTGLTSTLYGWQYRARQWAAGRLYRLCHGAARNGAAPLKDPDRVLLILAGLIGDTVMSTPVIVEARRLWPRARITVLGRRHNCEMLAACPLIDARVECPALPFSIRRRRQLARLKLWLRQQDFDLALIVLGDQFALMLAHVGIPVRVGASGHPLEPCLTHTYEVRGARLWGPPERLNALRALGREVRDVQPRLWVSQEMRRAARRRLAQLGLPDGSPYAAVHPFGSAARQWWPAERVGELAEGLWRQFGLRTVVIGGPETRGRLPVAAQGAAVDATGRLSMAELLGTVDQARLAISTDSGPFHVAGALGRPLVGLFRAKRPEHANRYPQARVALGQDSACDMNCRWDRCQTTPCRQMSALSVRDVLEAIRLAQRSVPAAPQESTQWAT